MSKLPPRLAPTFRAFTAHRSTQLPICRCALARSYSTQEPPSTSGAGSSPISPQDNSQTLSQSQSGEQAVKNFKKEFGGFPDLSLEDPLLDSFDAETFAPTKRTPYRNRVVLRNEPKILDKYRAVLDTEATASGSSRSGAAGKQGKANKEKDDEDDQQRLLTSDIPQGFINRLYRFPLVVRRVTQQTGKGKIHRMYTLIVVGDGNGLVGYGEGKDDEAPRAAEKALAEAVRNMDYVERFEDRTIWTDMEGKLGATRILLRPRPVGFGLQCNPNVHQVLKAAGIKDISAKVWGSRNQLNVIKTLFRMLHAGNAPLAMGDGVGGRGKRMDKGSGLRTRDAMERERGRKMVDLRTW